MMRTVFTSLLMAVCVLTGLAQSKEVLLTGVFGHAVPVRSPQTPTTPGQQQPPAKPPQTPATPVVTGAQQPPATPLSGPPPPPGTQATTPPPALQGNPEDFVVQFYRCRYIRSASALTMLNAIFPPEQLRAVVGPEPYSPRLEQGATSSGSQITTVKSMADTEGGLVSHDLILRGTRNVVSSAISILEKADHHRRQVRLNIKIVDIDIQRMLDLGVKWNWTPNYTASEKGNGNNSAPGFFPTGFNVGTFVHTPLFINAALSARGEEDTVRLLAMPNLTLLDGERSFILIGERILFPKIVSYSTVGLPIYDKEEVKTGIYIQVAVQMSDQDDMTLSVYPQVSVIAGFLDINGTKYPEINTREEQTTVRIQNKETLVIGGLLREDEITKLTTVPGLSKIPLFGELFRNRSKSKIKSDLVIMITPEIIAFDESGVAPNK
jgi:type II secretory pathway component GspD/PulD (secretin)